MPASGMLDDAQAVAIAIPARGIRMPAVVVGRAFHLPILEEPVGNLRRTFPSAQMRYPSAPRLVSARASAV